VLSGETIFSQGDSAHIRSRDESRSGSTWISLEVGMHIGGAQSYQEDKALDVDVSEVKVDGGSPSGGGDKMIILNSLGWLQLDIYLGSLTRNFRRIWSYPPFIPPPCAFLINNNTQKIVNKLNFKKEKRRKEVMTQVKEKVDSTILYPK
jgi:hypothetical protein